MYWSIMASAAAQDDLYAQALSDSRTTSPPYVLITIVDGVSGEERTLCTTANHLLVAIHYEHGLAYDAESIRRANEIALANSSHRFTFSNPEARANIPVRYTAEELRQAKALYAPYGKDELQAILSAPLSRESPRQRIRSFLPGAALGCALLERGLLPYQADIGHAVYLKP
jgi:hypothetical protein